MTTAGIETPSGKDAGSENFPVGSILLPKPLRPHVACFYRFARAADDIADNPNLTAQEKLDRLEAYDRALVNGSSNADLSNPDRLRDSLLETGVTDVHARDLLRAFMQDSVKTRYESWDDLMTYCRLSPRRRSGVICWIFTGRIQRTMPSPIHSVMRYR